jgi:hypothetical protein
MADKTESLLFKKLLGFKAVCKTIVLQNLMVGHIIEYLYDKEEETYLVTIETSGGWAASIDIPEKYLTRFMKLIRKMIAHWDKMIPKEVRKPEKPKKIVSLQ